MIPSVADSLAAGERVRVFAVMPFRQRERFLSTVEIALFRALREVAGARYVLLTKLGLNELFYVARPNENVHYFNRLFRKSIDFLLCSPKSLKPEAGVQLVRAGKEGILSGADQFLRDLFEAVKLPLVGVPPAERYEGTELVRQLEAVLAPHPNAAGSTSDIPTDSIPMCPVCGKMMVLRVQQGSRAKGRLYYGCIDNPSCPGRVAA
jgi:hypothetical protein